MTDHHEWVLPGPAGFLGIHLTARSNVSLQLYYEYNRSPVSYTPFDVLRVSGEGAHSLSPATHSSFLERDVRDAPTYVDAGVANFTAPQPFDRNLPPIHMNWIHENYTDEKEAYLLVTWANIVGDGFLRLSILPGAQVSQVVTSDRVFALTTHDFEGGIRAGTPAAVVAKDGQATFGRPSATTYLQALGTASGIADSEIRVENGGQEHVIRSSGVTPRNVWANALLPGEIRLRLNGVGAPNMDWFIVAAEIPPDFIDPSLLLLN